jgi:putative ABC transport system permease protein
MRAPWRGSRAASRLPGEPAMNLLTLAWADLRYRKLAHLLHLLLLTLGIAMIVALLGIASQVERRFEQDGRGVDAVVGAKGSPLQLILSSVYHLDIPTGNIPLADAEALARHPMVAAAIPLALGDSARGFRIVGTSAALIDGQTARYAVGQVWNAPMEAVIGAAVARAGLKLGDRFVGQHGLAGNGRAHGEQPYRVVGVLAATGGVLDRLILTSVDSVWALHGQGGDDDHDDHVDHGDGDEDEHRDAPREITALLIRYRSPMAAAGFPRYVNSQTRLQAAVPALETARLLNLFGIGFEALTAIAVLMIGAAALSVFVAVVQSMDARQYELAVLRCLGASRRDTVAVLWLGAVLLCAAGTLAGWLLGHAAVAALGRLQASSQSLGFSGTQGVIAEWWLLVMPFAVASLAVAIPAWRTWRVDIAALLTRS